MPMPFQIASWALDGISYIATDKSVTDHGISMVAQKDCALLRVVQGQELCSTYDGSKTIAVAETGTSETALAITAMQLESRQVTNEAIAMTETNSQLPKASNYNYSTVELKSVDNPRQLIIGKRVWSDRLDADMYYVVGSFSNNKNAQRLISKHRDLGPAVLVSLVNGNRVYRVAVGPFDGDQKRDVRLSIKKSGIVDAWALNIDHQEWRLASPQGFFNTEKPLAPAPEIIKPLPKSKPMKTQFIGDEVAEMPMPRDKFSVKKKFSVSRQFSKT